MQGGDAVSAEYLAATLHRRARALVDDPSTALFFGRTDHTDGERWYIGRRHVADGHGDPVVVDWRADVSRRLLPRQPHDAAGRRPAPPVRRRAGRITAYEDEHLTDPAEADARSAILAREIERPRVGPMRDIVATIQPEQDEIVRADVGDDGLRPGCAGHGQDRRRPAPRGMAALRLPRRLARAGVLVVGPNGRSWTTSAPSCRVSARSRCGTRRSRTSSRAAARSAEFDGVRQVRSGVNRARGADPVERAMLKGDERMATVLHRAVWAQVRTPESPLALPRGSRTWRLPPHEVREMVEELRTRGVRYAAARDMLAQRLAHAVLVQMEEAGDSPDDRVQDAVARSREVRRYVDAVWPAIEPRAVLFRLFTDVDFLVACTADVARRRRAGDCCCGDPPPRSRTSARWSPADVVLLDELADLLRRTSSLGHVVLDEAQDLSPMQLRAVGRRCATGAATVLGDIAQGTTPWATPSWEAALRHLGRPEADLEVLDRGFRVPASVIEFAARLLPAIAPGMSPPTSVRDDPGSLELVGVPSAARLWPATLAAVQKALVEEGSVAVIVADGWVRRAARTLADAGVEHEVLGSTSGPGQPPPDERDADRRDLDDPGVTEPDGALPPRVSVVPATTAKGLEYDRVVVVEPARIADDEPDVRTGLRRLYVVLTRAVSGLAVIHHRALPDRLAEPVAAPHP